MNTETDRTKVAATVASMQQQARDAANLISSLDIEFRNLYFDAEAGDAKARRRCEEIRKEKDAAQQKIGDLEGAIAVGKQRLAKIREAEISEQRLEDWLRVKTALARRAEIARELDSSLEQLAERVKQLIQLGDAAHAVAARHLSMDQAWACTPGRDHLAQCIFGTFLRVSGLPREFVLDLSELGLSQLHTAKPPSTAVEFQNARILDRLPRELEDK